MLKKTLIASSLALSMVIPTISLAEDNCPCKSGPMSQCQSMMDKMMMDKLGKKDNQYDKRFIDLMIPHHEAAIMMAKDALNNAIHPEIKDMAQKIIDTQQKEIEQLKAWRSQWYGNEQSSEQSSEQANDKSKGQSTDNHMSH
ncbi:Uncharacterized protein conserved in bacteria [Legionella busanensis]|uniref:Uncharacterized protein conserved in bacteria n=1 Tax=Legionella busanensis TaxID=190655 RepID=A0A378JIW1_9GAMM|nr:DUF305 domain-containing protein [Legionella busanensis]STX50160.1 Uncharacterized protein conserved in bacteria [Legionella busanensis]